MSGLSIHAVDVAAGKPAVGMQVEVFRLGLERERIAEGMLGPAGALDHPVARERLAAGPYEAIFHIGSYLARPDAFIDVAHFRFRVLDPDEHVHLPMKFTAWGYALFRGT